MRVDPDQCDLNTAVTFRATVRSIARNESAALAINANFFDRSRNPRVVVRFRRRGEHTADIVVAIGFF